MVRMKKAPDASRAFVALVVGGALLYAVCVSFFYTTWLVPDYLAMKPWYARVREVPTFGVPLLVAVLIALRVPVPRVAVGGVGYACLAAGVASVAYGVLTGGGTGLLVASAVLSGMGIGAALPAVLAELAGFSQGRMTCALGLVFGVGMLAAIATGALPVALRAVACAAMLVGSIACWMAGRRLMGAGAADAPARSAAGHPARSQIVRTLFVPVIGTAALAVVYSVMNHVAITGSADPRGAVVVYQVGGVVAALVFLAYGRLGAKASPILVLNLFLGLLALGILFLPFVSANYIDALNGLVAGGWKFMTLCLFQLTLLLFLGDVQAAFAAVGVSFAFSRIALTAVAPVELLFDAADADLFVKLVAVAFFFLYVILMTVWCVNSFERKKAQSRADTAAELLGHVAQTRGNLLRARCEAIAAAHGLTARERDVLEMLAQGRDTGYMCDEFGLARNTVKGYQKTLYAKLGVHSRQEVIDLVQVG